MSHKKQENDKKHTVENTTQNKNHRLTEAHVDSIFLTRGALPIELSRTFLSKRIRTSNHPRERRKNQNEKYTHENAHRKIHAEIQTHRIIHTKHTKMTKQIAKEHTKIIDIC